jgi:hypothetical protein
MKKIQTSGIALLVLLLIAVGTPSFAQSGAPSSNANKNGRSRIGGDQFRDDITHLIKNDSCRLDLESKLADSDSKAIQTDLITLKDGEHDIDSLQKLIREARKDKDTSIVHALLIQAWTLETKLQFVLIDVRGILWRYPGALAETIHECTRHDRDSSKLVLTTKPLYPDPVYLNSAVVPITNLSYSISEPATVNITVSDAEGNLVKQILDAPETEGDHVQIISITGLKAGVYYIRIAANNQVQTLKLVIVS